MRERILAVDVQGSVLSYLEQLIDAGDMPTLAAVRQRSAAFALDPVATLPDSSCAEHLRWEYLIAGLTVHESWRHGSIRFDPRTYDTWQRGERFEPFFTQLAARTVIFDAPSCDLTRGERVRGIVGWGVHDRFQPLSSNPPELASALLAGPGPYPAHEVMHAQPWPSPEGIRAMGETLVRGVGARTRAARWLLTEQLTDWDIALVTGGEAHSGAETFWHGIDSSYPLHDHPSATVAASAMRDVYRANDRMIAELLDAAQPSSVLIFAMRGLGPNNTDGPTMFLLAELLYRWSCGRSLMQVPAEWKDAPRSIPVPVPGQEITSWSSQWFPPPSPQRPRGGAIRGLVPRPARRVLRGARRALQQTDQVPTGRTSVAWSPTTRYSEWWPSMKAFALPSFAEGRIRVNLRGREQHGIVEPSQYSDLCDELEALVRACHDPRTGEPVVEHVNRASADPLELTNAEVDLAIVWRGMACAFEHPDLGTIGPVPFWRTGAHTGPCGFAYVSGPEIVPGNYGTGSMLDVAPTLVELTGAQPIEGLAGTSLLSTDDVPLDS
jgi:hypothetical protein